MSTEYAIEVENLIRLFSNVCAVDDLSFQIKKNQVVGFIGANGAGKTTTMRIMATLDQADSGTVRICGYDVSNFQKEVRACLGWMPDTIEPYPNMAVWEYMDFFARAIGLRGQAKKSRVEEVMAFAELTPLADRLMNTLSKGMGQRLCFGRALLSDPEVLILDEPAAGLDPKARVEFKRLIHLLAGRNKTIFISSHILSELGEMCDTLLFIDKGRMLHHGSSETLKRTTAAACTVLIECESSGLPLIEALPPIPGVRVMEETSRGARISVSPDDAATVSGVLRQLISTGVQVVDFHREERRLEDAFIEILKKAGKS